MNEENKGTSLQEELFDWAQNIAIILTAVVLIFSFAFRIIGVEGPSMMPTLQNGDWMLVSKLFYEPEYGDIVVLRKTEFMDKPIVKRIIATEGQTVDIDFNTGRVIVDGVVYDEPYINEPTLTGYDVTFPQTVPKGCVFVMGDNRNRSSDSRDGRLGMVDERCIIGRLVCRLLPINAFGSVRQDYVQGGLK